MLSHWSPLERRSQPLGTKMPTCMISVRHLQGLTLQPTRFPPPLLSHLHLVQVDALAPPLQHFRSVAFLLQIYTFCSGSSTRNVNQEEQRESSDGPFLSSDKSGDMSRDLPGPLPRGPSASRHLPPLNLPPKGLLQQTHPLPLPEASKKTLLPHHCQFWG